MRLDFGVESIGEVDDLGLLADHAVLRLAEGDEGGHEALVLPEVNDPLLSVHFGDYKTRAGAII